jgi:hypothetical protein
MSKIFLALTILTLTVSVTACATYYQEPYSYERYEKHDGPNGQDFVIERFEGGVW